MDEKEIYIKSWNNITLAANGEGLARDLSDEWLQLRRKKSAKWEHKVVKINVFCKLILWHFVIHPQADWLL